MYRLEGVRVCVHKKLQHPPSRISIHRCYKLCRGGAIRGVWRGDSRGTRVGLCRILDMNFREYLFHALR